MIIKMPTKTPKTKPHLYGRFRNLNAFSKQQIADFKKYMLQTLLKKISTTVKNKHTGITIKISKSGLKHSLSTFINVTKIKSLTALEDVLKTAFLVDVTNDKHKIRLKHLKFKNLINVDGVVYFIEVGVKEDNQGNFYYHQELTQIKKTLNNGQ